MTTARDIVGWASLCSAVLNFGLGVFACVKGGEGGDADRAIPLVFHVAGPDGRSSLKTLPSDWSIAFSLAGMHLVGTACTGIVAGVYLRHLRLARSRGDDQEQPLNVNRATASGGDRYTAWDRFVAGLESTTNLWRWIEYALSAPLGVAVATLCAGGRDLHFLLSQMVLAVAIVVVAFEQERKPKPPEIKENVRGARVPVSWSPVVVAAGLFACQWTLVFWQASAARGHYATMVPAVLYVVGVLGASVTQALTSAGFRDGLRALRRTFGAAENDDSKDKNARHLDASRVEILHVVLIFSGKLVFTFVVLFGTIPNMT
jgi:hypothetical protein